MTKGDIPDIHLVYKFGVDYEPVIAPAMFADPDEIYEIWTVHFPVHLSKETKSRIEQLEGPLKIYHATCSEQEYYLGPMDGLITSIHGWIEGEAEYQGQVTKRLVCFLHWQSEEAERLYKEGQKWYKKTRDGRELRLAIDIFVDDLKECGMLGFETRHCRFEEIDEFNL